MCGDGFPLHFIGDFDLFVLEQKRIDALLNEDWSPMRRFLIIKHSSPFRDLPNLQGNGKAGREGAPPCHLG